MTTPRRTRREALAEKQAPAPTPSARFDQVVVTSSRGQHPDDGTLDGYAGRDLSTVRYHAVVHRTSDGHVAVTHVDGPPGGAYTILVLGNFEGGPSYRPYSDIEDAAVQTLVTDLHDAGLVEPGTQVYYEYGIPEPHPHPNPEGGPDAVGAEAQGE